MAAGGWRKGSPQNAGSSFILHPSSFVLLVALAGAPSGAPAVAQELVDPMRPPPGFAEAPPEAMAVPGPVPGNQLQSVIIWPKRRAAIINGVVVELGEKYGDAVLTKVAEDEVVLKSDRSEQVLKLYPAVEMVKNARDKAKGARSDPKPNAKAGATPGAAMRPQAAPAAGGGPRAR